MTYATEATNFDDSVLANSTDSPGLSTNFGENFITGVGQTIDNNLSISEWFVRDSGGWSLGDRNDELKKLRDSGELTDQEYSSFISSDSRGMKYPDYSAMAEYANNKLGTSIRTDKEINDQMRAGLKGRRERAQDITDRQTTTGFIGNVAGSMTGFALEPAGIAAIPLEGLMLGRSAYVLSQATTRLARASRVAGVSAVANMATETAIQPIMFNWHEEIGVDMTWKDALFNVASVGVLSGAITGAASGIRTKAGFEKEQFAAQLQQKIKRGEALTVKEKTILDAVDESELPTVRRDESELPTVRREPDDELTVKDVRNTLATVRREADTVVDDREATTLLKRMEDELNTVPNGSAKEHFERMDNTEKKFNEYTNRTVTQKKIDEVIDDQQLEADFDAMVQEGLFTKELNEINVDQDQFSKMFDGKPFDQLSKKGQKQAINETIDSIGTLKSMDARTKALDLCLLGGG